MMSTVTAGTFLSRLEAAALVGACEARQAQRLQAPVKVACRINGRVYAARENERIHAQVTLRVLREQEEPGDIEDGFVLTEDVTPAPPAPPKPAALAAYRTAEECARRWPRIIQAMRWKACLSAGEAACCLRDYRGVRLGVLPPELWLTGGEAVDHYGGSLRVVLDATCARVRRLFLNGELRRSLTPSPGRRAGARSI